MMALGWLLLSCENERTTASLFGVLGQLRESAAERQAGDRRFHFAGDASSTARGHPCSD